MHLVVQSRIKVKARGKEDTAGEEIVELGVGVVILSRYDTRRREWLTLSGGYIEVVDHCSSRL